MHVKLFATVFATVFLAELGDKTQLATVMYAAAADTPRWVVFLAAAGALVLSTAIGVIAGSALASHLNPRVLSWVAGSGFILIGIWTIARA